MNGNDPTPTHGPETFRITRRRALTAVAGATAASPAFFRFGGNAQEFPKPPFGQPASASPVASPVPPLSDALLDDVIGELASAGVAVYGTAEDSAPLVALADPGPVSLLMSQLRPMVREAMVGGGVLGVDLDALVTDRELFGQDDAETFDLDVEFPEIDGSLVFPPSLLTASYVQTVDSPGAALIRRFRPDIAVERATTQLIPSLALIVFAAEIAREHGAQAGASTGGVRALVPVAAQGGICSQAEGFIDSMIDRLFSMLTLDLGSSAPGVILGSIINGVILGVRVPLKAALASLTKPVLDLIRDIAGVLAIAGTVISTIRPWTLGLTAAPPATRLAVGSEPGLLGEVTALVDLGGLDEWPVDVADCAAASGVPLPPLKPANARCSWSVTGSRLNLVQSDEQPPALDKDAKAILKYHTLSESEEVAKGDPVQGLVIVTATVARPEVDDLKRTLSNLLFAQLPDILNQFVRPYLGPVVDQLLGKITSLSDSQGRATIAVLYHQPPKETPTPEPEPEDDGGVSLDFTMEPTFPTSGAGGVLAVVISLSVASCDEVAWAGEVGLSAHFDSEGFRFDAEGVSPVAWSFAGGDRATAAAGPFEGTIVIPQAASSPLTYSLDLAITRTVDSQNDGAMSLTFDVVLHSAFFGSTEAAQLEQFTNLGVPIPVVAGGSGMRGITAVVCMVGPCPEP